MIEKIIVFVDYENIGIFESVCLFCYECFILFIGFQQEFICFLVVMYVGDILVSVFQVVNVLKNNVDFYLVFELGRFSVIVLEEMIFYIILNDKGYDGVIVELCRVGR